jgi:hypothetical protein
MAEIGVHATGAFSSDGYGPIRTHNAANPNEPLTLAPSFGFLGNFRTSKGYAYPNDNATPLPD